MWYSGQYSGYETQTPLNHKTGELDRRHPEVLGKGVFRFLEAS